LLLVIVALGACDRPADPPVKPAPPSPSSASLAPPAVREFADDTAFARFASTLEPVFTPTIHVIQLLRNGEWACGYRRDMLNYILWPVNEVIGPRTYFLDADLADAPDTIDAFYSRDRLVRLAPDGSWGYFVWPESKKTARAELWRLPTVPGDKAVKFHAFPASESHPSSPSISDDGRLLLFGKDQWSLLLVDAAGGTARTVALHLPDDLKPNANTVITLRLAGLGGMIYVNKQVNVGADGKRDLRFSFGVGSLAFSDPPMAARIEGFHWLSADQPVGYTPSAVSPDGRLLLVHDYTGDDQPAALWRLPAQAGEKPAMLGTLALTREVSDLPAAWSRDGRRLAIGVESKLHIFDTAALAADTNAPPAATHKVTWGGTHLAFSKDGSTITLAHRLGGVTTVPLDAPSQVDARIGEARIRWTVPRDPPDIAQWPALAITHSIKRGEGQVPSTLIVEIQNTGAGPAHQVRATLTVAPPLAAPAAEPEQTAKPAPPLSILGTLHQGVIQPSLSIKRYLDLPADPRLLDRARRFSLTVTSKYGFNPAPIHWLHLPRTLKDEAEYHALAKAIFDAASKTLSEARGEPFKQKVTLSPLEADGFGFMVSSGVNVLYQNPFKMDENALRVNRAVMQVDSQDELMRHAQMMLFWYLPHELVHCADHRRGWETEFVANMIQPYVTARMLEAMPDSPYSGQSMAFVYDRYVKKLRPHLKDEEIARIERFINDDGEGTPPWDVPPSAIFNSNTPAYVYFGARINQYSWARQSKLEDLCKWYLTEKP
jgi:hypothetical protein